MNIRALRIVSPLALVLLAAFTIGAENYKVDPVHSSLVFRAKHANANYVYGRFNKFEGTIVEDADPKNMKFQASAQVESIDTANAKRDEHLRSPDFFSAKEFGTIAFTSTEVRKTGENTYDVTGQLTLHGQTKPITVKITKTGASSGERFGTRVGYLAEFSIKRSDFGMSGMTQAISDEIDLTASLAAVKQ